jgi:hypothetical protein
LDPAADTTFSQLDYVQEALHDAERLLHFASETGLPVDDGTKKAVLDARAAFAKGLDESTTANLLTALAKLATMVSPVTPESLKVLPKDIQKRHPYRNSAVVLAVVIIVYSTLSFVTSSIADSIRADITTANNLAVKLNSEFPTPATASQSDSKPRSGGDSGQTQMTTTTRGVSPTDLPAGLLRPDVVKDFQQYAATIRNIDGQARELSFYMHPYKFLRDPASIDPYYKIREEQPAKLTSTFELPVPLNDYGQAAVDRTRTYQQVRYFAQHLVDDVSFYYGAVSSCILPVLYALLGTFAYLLRTYERKVSTRSYVRSATDSARFLTAAIGGAVVGLFSNFTLGQGNKVSPLAIAFLVGYAVDVFYAFLETLIQSFSKTALASNPSNRSVRTPTSAPDSAKSSS